MRRAFLAAIAAVACSAWLAVPGPVTPARAGTTGGALFGGTANLVRDEPALGRKLAVVRVYYRYGEQFLTPQVKRLMAGGRTLIVSLDSYRTPYPHPTFAQITAGDEDAYLHGFLTQMNAAAHRYGLNAIYFCLQHEPDLAVYHKIGTVGQYRRAWVHAWGLWHWGRVRWMFISTHRDFEWPRPSWLRWAPAARWLWPGNSYVDAVGSDGDYSPGCKPGTTPQTYANSDPGSIFDQGMKFALENGRKPYFAAEYAATARWPKYQARFITEMGAWVQRQIWHVGGISYWDGNHGCDYKLTKAGMSALRAIGHSRALDGRG